MPLTIGFVGLTHLGINSAVAAAEKGFQAVCYDADAALITAEVQDPKGYGRVVRSVEGWVTRIVEDVEVTAEQRVIREINAGIYALSTAGLFSALKQIAPSPRKGEYYLTDLIGIWAAQGKRVMALMVENAGEVIGVDTKERLKDASELVQGWGRGAT